MSRLLDWLLGRGRNPLEAPGSHVVGTIPHVRTPPREDAATQQLADEADALLEQQARVLGVDVSTLVEMLEQRELFIAKVEAEPRAWGFDLLAADEVRRDVASEYRRATRLTGTLGESFLSAYEPLMAAVPDPLTMPPDGLATLPEQLEEHAGLTPEAARDVAQHIRTTVQATLGQPLTKDAVERAVREAAWDHDFDAATYVPKVVDALETVL